MADPTAFISMSEVQAHLSSLTTTRLTVTEQDLVDACSAVVSLIRGTVTPWPSTVDYEWKSLARQWLAAYLYSRYPEYFRAKMDTLEDVERRIARRARIEPAENRTYARSDGAADAWDGSSGGCGCP